MDDCQFFVYSAMKIGRKFVKEYDTDHPEQKLTASENLLLEIVSLNPGITIGDLAKKMDYSKPMVTKNMKTPLEQELIMVRDIDGRTTSVRVTPKGMELVKIGKIKREMFVDNIFTQCTPEEKENFMLILRKLALD